MATHTPHEDIAEAGLNDECPRCDEHAVRPHALDDQSLGALFERMIDVEFGDGTASYRSKNEAKAGGYLYDLALLMERFGMGSAMLLAQVRAGLRA